MKKPILLFIGCILFISCKDEVKTTVVETTDEVSAVVNSNNKLKQLDWLLGSWQNISEEGTSLEIWEKKNDSMYVASSYTIVENDTVFAETILLHQTNNEVYFRAADASQNGGNAVSFKLIPDKPGLFVFENNLHDFPKRIIYTNPVKDSIHAWIVGTQEGKFRKVDFYFERVN